MSSLPGPITTCSKKYHSGILVGAHTPSYVVKNNMNDRVPVMPLLQTSMAYDTKVCEPKYLQCAPLCSRTPIVVWKVYFLDYHLSRSLCTACGVLDDPLRTRMYNYNNSYDIDK